eukprot:1088634-Pyramimonas_sp.AAC.1
MSRFPASASTRAFFSLPGLVILVSGVHSLGVGGQLPDTRRHKTDWSIVRIYPHSMHLIGRASAGGEPPGHSAAQVRAVAGGGAGAAPPAGVPHPCGGGGVEGT